ncbi:DNA-binding protein [Candidatus Curtissbacteria bacterium RIFCSPLOWO2_01_FULL_41_18]|uniref:DNA-binding protein n=1 Tax=Candidatus Curtissbacteria bacterium RIFCSPLOWO2_01_FULL_41_18 TaxID=1797727 RepID=A0A1F5HIK3_9BACT|nr:MAG: DNA-binding protein [Candidatus Curtissbacteria bacterium RIFCSPLOWO2_01_FULL_41_18]
MTKKELIEKVSKKVGLTKKSAQLAVDAVFGNIKEALIKGDKVVVTGFGTFKIRSRATRTGRNPQTGSAIKIVGHKLPGFTAGKTLKRLIK